MVCFEERLPLFLRNVRPLRKAPLLAWFSIWVSEFRKSGAWLISEIELDEVMHICNPGILETGAEE
jgi:hypothetical protein